MYIPHMFYTSTYIIMIGGKRILVPHDLYQYCSPWVHIILYVIYTHFVYSVCIHTTYVAYMYAYYVHFYSCSEYMHTHSTFHTTAQMTLHTPQLMYILYHIWVLTATVHVQCTCTHTHLHPHPHPRTYISVHEYIFMLITFMVRVYLYFMHECVHTCLNMYRTCMRIYVCLWACVCVCVPAHQPTAGQWGSTRAFVSACLADPAQPSSC